MTMAKKKKAKRQTVYLERVNGPINFCLKRFVHV